MSEQKLVSNPRGIPSSPFVERVEDYVSEAEPVEIVLKKFQEAISKYKFMEVNLLQRRKVLEEKIPEIEKTIAMAKAKIEATGSVYLWLGANVMLEYTCEEAKDLLTSKLDTAKNSLKNTLEDLEFLRSQITTMEVNTARVYNWDVKQRRLLREQQGSSSAVEASA
ncbi:hypothetical protein G6F42_023165 [Rhizopus arrhizus]|nr:hypothetical protein G6F42_023165 [Rhizopus arrhizus]